MGFGSQYVGNPSGVQAPDTAPATNKAPSIYLPSDLDGATWANLFQGLKDLADNAAFVSNLVGGSGAISVGGTTLPTPAFTRGALYKESGLFAGAFINGGTSVTAGVNIATFTHNSTGSYTVTFNTAGSSVTRMIPMGIVMTTTGYFEANTISTSSMNIATYNSSGTPIDTTCSFVVFHL